MHANGILSLLQFWLIFCCWLELYWLKYNIQHAINTNKLEGLLLPRRHHYHCFHIFAFSWKWNCCPRQTQSVNHPLPSTVSTLATVVLLRPRFKGNVKCQTTKNRIMTLQNEKTLGAWYNNQTSSSVSSPDGSSSRSSSSSSMDSTSGMDSKSSSSEEEYISLRVLDFVTGGCFLFFFSLELFRGDSPGYSDKRGET